MTNKLEVHIVPPQISPIRLQEYGVGIFEAVYTKSALKKALKKQYITVDNAIATSATFIKGGECIRLSIPETIIAEKDLKLNLHVLYEDDHLAFVHKPAGILVSGNSFKTIARALPQNLTQSSLSDATQPQPVHRLDYPTTGILLAGKTSSSIRALNQLFELKKIEKQYYAVTIGAMKDSGTINFPIDNKPSTSTYQVEERCPSKRFGTLNLVKLQPLSGRRHQLRKHLSALGHPILGDPLYGMEGLILQKKGLYLHAFSIEFTHPFTEEQVVLTDPLPKKFKKIFPS